MERIVLRHLSGSKANQVEEFPLNHVKELVLGRDPSATVKYDPDRDDLVGRQHARIAQDPADPTQFIVTDLNSRNGTFVNKQRITTPTRINVGDVIQLGQNGPEAQFDLEPRPASAVKPTRIGVNSMAATVATNPNPPAPPTRAVSSPGASSVPPTMPVTGSPSGTVGKATVERMISANVAEAKKTQGRKFLAIGGAAFIAVVLLFAVLGGVGFWLYKRSQAEQSKQVGDIKKQIDTEKANAAMTPAAIAEAYGNAVVYIEVAWRLIDTNKQAQVYHQFFPNDKSVLTNNPADRGQPLVPGGPAVLAAYVDVGDGNYEPLLTYTAKGALTKPIGGRHTGSGFIVTSDGFILTNRHVAATWKTSYQFPPDTPPGVIFTQNGIFPKVVAPPQNWVPANTKQTGRQLAADFKGVNDTLDVTLSKKENRIAATLKQVSDRHDVAMIKIDVPGQLTKVELFDNYDAIKPGDSATILGYPGDSPPVYGVIKSSDVFNSSPQYKIIPDPSVTPTNVSRVIRGQEGDSKKDQQISIFGDVIQLSTASTGPGNSGGPVFDDHGRVIGIFFAGLRQGIAVTYAIPIRFGKEFLAGQ